MATISIDVDLDDIYWDLHSREKRELALMLEEDGFCIPVSRNDSKTSVLDDMWSEQISKLLTARLQLTKEQEQTILEITKNL